MAARASEPTTDIKWGARVRARWLPEAVDPRPWRSRCGYACSGIRRDEIAIVRPDLHAEARAARADGSSTHALLEAVRHLGSRERLTPSGAWTSRDDYDITTLGPRVPLELLAVVLRRTPRATAARARALGVDLDAGWSFLYEIDRERGIARMTTDEIVTDAIARLGAPAAWSLASIARAAGISGVGALKAVRRLGLRPAIPRRARTTRGTYERGDVALHAAVYVAIDAWRVIVAVASERARREAPRPTCSSCGERPATRDGATCSRCSARERKRLSRSQAG